MNRIRTVALILGALVAVSATTAVANRHSQHRRGDRNAESFSGTCTFTGAVRFRPALTNSPQRVRDFARARGTCSGHLTDRRGRVHDLDGTTVRYTATDVASGASCAASAGAVGTGALRFPHGAIRFDLSETRAVAVAQLSLKGVRGGAADGQANVSADADPVEVAQACAGDGLASAPVEIRIATTSPISG